MDETRFQFSSWRPEEYREVGAGEHPASNERVFIRQNLGRRRHSASDHESVERRIARSVLKV